MERHLLYETSAQSNHTVLHVNRTRTGPALAPAKQAGTPFPPPPNLMARLSWPKYNGREILIEYCKIITPGMVSVSVVSGKDSVAEHAVVASEIKLS